MNWSMDEDREMDEMDEQQKVGPTTPHDRVYCRFCVATFYGVKGTTEAADRLAEHLREEHNRPAAAAGILRPAETGGTPRTRVRWTVTGYGPPVGTRKETWTALLDLVALAEHRGLRVEVTEVEEEDR